MSTIPSEKQLLEHACHIGHRREKWNPKMKSFLYGVRKGIHVFDLTQTRSHLENVCDHMKKLQAEGKTILFVSTKQQSIPMVEKIADAVGQPMVTKKWIPGLLTNWPTIKRRLKYYLDLQHSFQSGEVEKYTKKEQTSLRKSLAKLEDAMGGISKMGGLPDAVFIVDAIRDRVAVLEAAKLKIPLFGICDSNADPDLFTAFIPANDDAVNSINLLLSTIEEQLLASPKKEKKDAMAAKKVVAAA